MRWAMLLVAACGGGGATPRDTGVPDDVPELVGIDPAAIALGAPDTTVTVTGDGFAADAVVLWDGAVRDSTPGPGTLAFTVTADELTLPHVHEVRVLNPHGGLSGPGRVDVVATNPAPILTSIAPDRAPVGSGDVTVALTGQLFAHAAEVRLDGAALATTYVDGDHLTAVIPAAALATATTAQITVANPTPGGGVSAALAFRVELVNGPGVLERVSLADGGGELAQGGAIPVVSDNGRYVAFYAPGDNVVPADTNHREDLFLRDTCRGATGCTPSTIPLSTQPDGTFSFSPQVGSPVGSSTLRFVAFHGSSLLVPGLPSGALVVRDTCIGATACTPATTQGTPGNARDGDGFDISDDGRYVAFVTASNLVAADTNSLLDVYIYDSCRGATGCTPSSILVSADAAGAAGNGTSNYPSMSADARYVAFQSTATSFASGDTNGRTDIFVRDTCLGAGTSCTPSTIRASLDSGGSGGTGSSSYASLDRTGRYVAFITDSKLDTADTNLQNDLYVRDTCLGAAGCTPSTRCATVGKNQVSILSPRVISAGGRYVTFAAESSVPPRSDVFVRDTCIGVTGCTPSEHLVSAAPGGTPDQGSRDRPWLTADGSLVVFESSATNLVTGDTNAAPDAFVAATGF